MNAKIAQTVVDSLEAKPSFVARVRTYGSHGLICARPADGTSCLDAGDIDKIHSAGYSLFYTEGDKLVFEPEGHAEE